MSDYEVSYEKKDKVISVDCFNVFDDIRKGCKDVLVLNALQAHAEVPIDTELSDSKGIEKAVETKLKKNTDSLIKEMKDLFESLRKLQKEEEQGNKKAATEAEKLVKDQEKVVKKWADTFGAQVRKAVQEEYNEQAEKKTQLRSTSRTIFRGMELADDAFEGGDSEVSPFVAEFGKALAGVGTEASKLSNDEKDTRLGLAESVKQLRATLDKYAAQVAETVNKKVEEEVKKGVKEEDAKKRAGKAEIDLALWARNNAKEVSKMEQSKEKYEDFLKDFERKLTDVDTQLDKLEKLMGQEKALQDNKELPSEIKAFKQARDTIVGTFEGKRKAASLVDRLFTDDYSNGATFVAAFRALENQKGTTKSGKAMQDAGRAIEKITKG